MEAANHGIPGIAVSVTVQVSQWRSFGAVDWTGARHFTRLLAAQVLADGLPDGVSVLNLNVPQSATADTELRKTAQSRQPYYVRRRPDPARRLTSRTSSRSTWRSTGTAWSQGQTSTRSCATRWPPSPRLTWRMAADIDWEPPGR